MYNIKNNNDVEKIADVFCYDDTTDMGHYDSYSNFCKRNMIYFAFVYGSKNVRVNSTPKKVLVSASSSDKIRELASNKIAELKEVSHSEAGNLKKHIMITYVDGQKKYFDYKEGFEEIFQIYEAETSTQELDVLDEPYLIFETKAESDKAKVIERISKLVKNKELKEIFENISDDCTLEVLGNKFKGIQEIKKEYKRRVGFLNSNLSKVKLYTIIEGTIDANKNSVLELKLEITDKSYNHYYYYVVHMDFNLKNQINKIEITPYIKESRIAKIMLDDDLIYIKRAEYNDFKS